MSLPRTARPSRRRSAIGRSRRTSTTRSPAGSRSSSTWSSWWSPAPLLVHDVAEADRAPDRGRLEDRGLAEGWAVDPAQAAAFDPTRVGELDRALARAG